MIFPKKLIQIEGKWYIILSMSDGFCYASKLFDINNDDVKNGVIWKFNSFYYQNEKWYGGILKYTVKLIRAIKYLLVGDIGGNRMGFINDVI